MDNLLPIPVKKPVILIEDLSASKDLGNGGLHSRKLVHRSFDLLTLTQDDRGTYPGPADTPGGVSLQKQEQSAAESVGEGLDPPGTCDLCTPIVQKRKA